MTKALINSVAFGIVFATIVLGGTTLFAYYTALEIHNTGSELLSLFLGSKL